MLCSHTSTAFIGCKYTKQFPYSTTFPRIYFSLPHQLFAVAVEDEGGCPAAFAADFGDLLLDSGGDGVFATAIAVIVDPGIVFDEALFYGNLFCSGHFRIESHHASGNALGLVTAVART